MEKPVSKKNETPIFGVRLDPELRAKLQRIADTETEGNLGQLLRKIIREYLAKLK